MRTAIQLKKWQKFQDDKSVPVNVEECVGCESCVEVCEEEAITIREVGSAAA